MQVRACVRVCVRACVRACARGCNCARAQNIQRRASYPCIEHALLKECGAPLMPPNPLKSMLYLIPGGCGATEAATHTRHVAQAAWRQRAGGERKAHAATAMPERRQMIPRDISADGEWWSGVVMAADAISGQLGR